MSQPQFTQTGKARLETEKLHRCLAWLSNLLRRPFATHMLMKFIFLDKFDRQARQRCNFPSSSLLLQKIISLSSLSVELIKHDKNHNFAFFAGLSGGKAGFFFRNFLTKMSKIPSRISVQVFLNVRAIVLELAQFFC